MSESAATGRTNDAFDEKGCIISRTEDYRQESSAATVRRIVDWVCALSLIAMIGLWPILVLAAGVYVLLFAIRLLWAIWLGTALALRWTWYNVILS